MFQADRRPLGSPRTAEGHVTSRQSSSLRCAARRVVAARRPRRHRPRRADRRRLRGRSGGDRLLRAATGDERRRHLEAVVEDHDVGRAPGASTPEARAAEQARGRARWPRAAPGPRRRRGRRGCARPRPWSARCRRRCRRAGGARPLDLDLARAEPVVPSPRPAAAIASVTRQKRSRAARKATRRPPARGGRRRRSPGR